MGQIFTMVTVSRLTIVVEAVVAGDMTFDKMGTSGLFHLLLICGGCDVVAMGGLEQWSTWLMM